MSTQSEPRLQPPGAGLPLIQRLYLKWYLGPFVASKTPWEQSRAVFTKIYTRVDQLCDGLSDEQMQKKVLVPPLRALEDSSRFWSAAMVLEHLVIVGRNMENIIVQLAKGQVPDLKVDVAKVKPLGQTPVSQVRKDFKDYYQNCPQRIDQAVRVWENSAKLVHPWFGPVNARQWAWIMSTHGGIHLQQLKEIQKGLSAPAQH